MSGFFGGSGGGGGLTATSPTEDYLPRYDSGGNLVDSNLYDTGAYLYANTMIGFPVNSTTINNFVVGMYRDANARLVVNGGPKLLFHTNHNSPAGNIDHTNGLFVGWTATTNALARVHALDSSKPQFRAAYDATEYADFEVDAFGDLYTTTTRDFYWRSGATILLSASTSYVRAGAPLVRNRVSGITASTTQTQGAATALTSDVNEVSTCANAGDGVKLRTILSSTLSNRQLVINNGAQSLNIYPASGQDLGQGTDTAVALPSGASALFESYSVTQWAQVV